MSVNDISQKVLIVCCLGRTGSTLLNGVLNSIPGYCIRGENWNLLFHLFQGYRSIVRSQISSFEENTAAINPFYGADKLDPELYVRRVRELIIEQWAPPKDATTLGFKEIRWDAEALGGNNLHTYFRFISRVFPRVTYVFLTRRTEAMSQSGWWKERDPKELADIATAFYDLVRSAPINYFEIDYDSLVSCNAEVPRMFEFLGEKYDEDAVRAVLAVKHSF